MSKKKKRPDDQPTSLKLLELQCAVIQHCAALKAVVDLMVEEKYPIATARLDQAVSALHAVVRGQAIGQTMQCPKCGTDQDVVAWVDEKICQHCGEELRIPGKGD